MLPAEFSNGRRVAWHRSSGSGCVARVECGQREPRAGWYSARYGRIEPAPAVALKCRGALPIRQATLLFPCRGAEPPAIDFEFDGTRAAIRTAELGACTVAAAPDGLAG